MRHCGAHLYQPMGSGVLYALREGYPVKINLTDAEREALSCVATGHEPALCDCNDAYRDPDDRFCEYAQETFAAVERIIGDRLAAQREGIAAAIESYRNETMIGRCYDCLYDAGRIARGYGVD